MITLFPRKVGGSILKVGGFLDGCWHLMRTLEHYMYLKTPIASILVLESRADAYGSKAKEQLVDAQKQEA